MSQFGYANPITVPQRGAARTNAAAAVKTIPFDYVFQFALQGLPKNKVQDVVEISTEGVFVALSVGYSLVADEKSIARAFEPKIEQFANLQTPAFVPFFFGGVNGNSDDLIGLKVIGHPGAEVVVLGLNTQSGEVPLGGMPIPEARGRIGSDGTVTIDFPRRVIAGRIIRIWDKTNDLLSQIFTVGSPSTPVIGPDPISGRLPNAGDTIVHFYGSPGSATANIPVTVSLLKNSNGDLVVERSNPLTVDNSSFPGRTTFRGQVELKVRKGETEEVTVPLSPGDLLYTRFQGPTSGSLADSPRVPLSLFVVPRKRTISSLTLAELETGLEKSGADLTRGFRLNPNAANLVAADLPFDQIPTETLKGAFETGCVAAEEVSFLYSLDVGNTGREYQSKPIHNIAGLGIANGDRPFRPFAKPIMFEPRSFVRIQVEELSGPKGTLFIVLQGYKMLGTGRIPG